MTFTVHNPHTDSVIAQLRGRLPVEPMEDEEGTGLSTALDELGHNSRQGVLYFLSTCSVPFVNVTSADEGVLLLDDVQAGVRTAGKLHKAMKSQGTTKLSDKEIEDAEVSTLRDTLKGWILAYLAKLAEGLIEWFEESSVKKAVDAAKDYFLKLLPELVKKLIPFASDAKGLVQGLYKAGDYLLKQRKLVKMNYLASLNSGLPNLVAEAIRDQLKEESKSGLKEAAKSAASLAVTALSAGLAALGKVIGSLIGAIYDFVTKFIEKRRLQSVFEDAEKLRHSGLADSAGDFQEVYAGWTSEVPIVAFLTMNMKITGGYMGFLKLMTDGGEVITQAQFDHGMSVMQTLKNHAAKFIRDYEIDIETSSTMVEELMKQAANEDIVQQQANSRWHAMKFKVAERAKASRAGRAHHRASEWAEKKQEQATQRFRSFQSAVGQKFRGLGRRLRHGS